MSMSNAELMDTGMRCLMDKLGTVEAERFISTLMQERFDYTQWQQDRFANVDLAAFNADARAWAAENERALGLR